jgi:branched-chain amino acid transport system substrate-binding protein
MMISSSRYAFMVIKVFTALAVFCSQASANQPKIKHLDIAIAGGFSGSGDVSASPYGVQLRQGVELALELNKLDLEGRGLKIHLKEYDIADTAGGAPASAISIKNSSAIAVIGYPFSSDALMAAPIFQKAGISLISPGASVDRINSFGKSVKSVAATNSEQGAILARLAWDKGAKEILTVAVMDCAYCQDLAKGFNKAFELFGGKIKSEGILSTDKDFSQLTKKLSHKKFDAIFLPNYEIVNSELVTSFSKAKMDPKFYLGGDGWGLVSTAFQAKPVKAYVLGHWHQSLTLPEAKRFRANYKNKYKSEPSDMGVLAFNSMQLLIQGLLNSKRLTRDGLVAGLNKVNSFTGALGKVSIKNEKQTRKNLLLEYTGTEVKSRVLRGAPL